MKKKQLIDFIDSYVAPDTPSPDEMFLLSLMKQLLQTNFFKEKTDDDHISYLQFFSEASMITNTAIPRMFGNRPVNLFTSESLTSFCLRWSFENCTTFMGTSLSTVPTDRFLPLGLRQCEDAKEILALMMERAKKNEDIYLNPRSQQRFTEDAILLIMRHPICIDFCIEHGRKEEKGISAADLKMWSSWCSN